MKTEAIILAAGQGSRMKSSKPKVLHEVAGKAMVQHVLDSSKHIVDHCHLVVGHGAEQVKESLKNEAVTYALQEQQLGTGHAVAQAMPEVSEESLVLVLYGDVPLIKSETLSQLILAAQDGQLGLLTATISNPHGYGRIVRNDKGEVVAIVEEKDADEPQKSITEVNTGILAVSAAHLNNWLPRLSSENAQKEYYLTDIIEMAAADGVAINTVSPTCFEETLGVNNRQQQAHLERWYQRQVAEQLMVQGVTLMDPERIDVRGTLTVGQDVVIDINTVFEGDVSLESGVYVGPNSIVKSSTIGEGTKINANSIVDQSIIGPKCDIGPFARIRPGTETAAQAKIGNFVETKKSIIGAGSKVNHLSYVGDSVVEDSVNIGAGTITCNYDGVNKYKTKIGTGSFVGSNSTLVAPVALASETFVAAGSVITKDTENGKLVVGRSRQKTIEGWKRPTKD